MCRSMPLEREMGVIKLAGLLGLAKCMAKWAGARWVVALACHGEHIPGAAGHMRHGTWGIKDQAHTERRAASVCNPTLAAPNI